VLPRVFRNRRLCYTLHGLSWIESISLVPPITNLHVRILGVFYALVRICGGLVLIQLLTILKSYVFVLVSFCPGFRLDKRAVALVSDLRRSSALCGCGPRGKCFVRRRPGWISLRRELAITGA
jgi:hypothetical protein